jgi:hypothetical protein
VVAFLDDPGECLADIIEVGLHLVQGACRGIADHPGLTLAHKIEVIAHKSPQDALMIARSPQSFAGVLA